MMGATVVRASSGGTTCIRISPWLFLPQKQFVSPSSAAIAPELAIAVPFSLARVSHVVSSPTSSLHQQAISHSYSFNFSSVYLMNSRLAPAFSSSFCGTRLEGFFSTRFRRRCTIKPAGSSCAKASVKLRLISQISNWCRIDERGGGIMSGAMENKGQRNVCTSSKQAGDGDQPTSSVLRPLPPVSRAKGLRISFCPRCGGATEEKIPVGEHEMRFVCTACGAVHYQNPKMVVGCLVEHEEKVLLCRRNIEPSYGLWTLPAGYMEIGESAAEGAARETMEEACADVQVLGLFAHLDIPFIGQSYIIFHARMKDPHFAPGPESLECGLFELNEIPFDSLAFSSIHVALKMYVDDIKAGKLKVHHGVIDKRFDPILLWTSGQPVSADLIGVTVVARKGGAPKPGASPSDLKGFVVRDVLSV